MRHNSPISVSRLKKLGVIDEWIPISRYAPEFVDTELDILFQVVNPEYFGLILNNWQDSNKFNNIMLAHKIIESGKPNFCRCHIPLVTHWKLENMEKLLGDYEAREVIEWLRYSFTISREEDPDPMPAQCNHKGAVQLPQVIDDYVTNEVKLGVAMGPFNIPPFLNRIGVSPLSTRPKRDSNKHHIIMDLSFPPGKSVNNAINKNVYSGKEICLCYPTIDTLA